ncbi:hypothetical protein PY254_14155 [Rhodanobacter sp. AS-Z3]|uniref:hypothetical protein n=1 Tax=Rhodanobacter sp. AS-Z3 TaxID=3031330 RepID=UPI0024798FB2|nr:hypothetical protein [Rhodanobacter sp. AS-Z3]WEN14366.1 hypothetical protein PY254_14155 [Rhodanobacter sp. AS-Z3]
MKSVQLTVVLSTLALCSGTAAAASASLNQFNSKVMPVLVRVNSQGKVTEASPAVELTPKIRRLMRANLDEMIRTPATDKHGRPIASQFVINLALNTAPSTNGNYDAKFAYVSTSPVPAGSWYWVHLDGVRVALANQNYRRQDTHYTREIPTAYHTTTTVNRSPAPSVNASSSSSTPAPRRDR